jgi:prepilin-type N-terminal cleavage/methylation domain-containing protein/prepilin-type processing-associated H-X9-DG protein
MRCNTVRKRPAFSLIELLVVIAIIAVLIGLLVPAVQKVRDTAMRLKCSHNLREIALATHDYHDTYLIFPPGINTQIDPYYGQGMIKKFGSPPDAGMSYSWKEAIFPYIEQSNLRNSLILNQVNQYGIYTDSQYYNCNGPNSLGAEVITLYVCPADFLPYPQVTIYTADNGTNYYFGMSSYGGNAGTVSVYWPSASLDGVFYINSRVAIGEITDGTSSTLFFGERYHFDPTFDRLSGSPLNTYGGWAWANVYAMEDQTLSSQAPINYMIPTNITLDPTYYYQNTRLGAFGSGHQGGANFAFADGSVRFLRDSLPQQMLQWLSTRAGGEATGDP